MSVLLSRCSLVTLLVLRFPLWNTQLALCSEIQVLEATSGPQLLPQAELRRSLQSSLFSIGYTTISLFDCFFTNVLPAAQTDADSSQLGQFVKTLLQNTYLLYSYFLQVLHKSPIINNVKL